MHTFCAQETGSRGYIETRGVDSRSNKFEVFARHLYGEEPKGNRKQLGVKSINCTLVAPQRNCGKQLLARN